MSENFKPKAMRKMATVFLVGLLILILVAVSLMQIGNVAAAPPAAPTPIMTGYSNDKVNVPVKFWADDTVITQSGGSTVYVLADAEALDIHYVLLQPTVLNTATFKIQFSNNGEDWEDGINVIATVITDTHAISQVNNFAYKTRLYVTVTTTNPLTISHLSALPRR